MQLGLEGKRILVTGGSKGLGYAIAGELIREGARVAICARNEQEVLAAGRELGAAHAQAADVTDPTQVQDFVAGSAEALGGIDALVNNASLMSALQRRPWSQIPLEEWDRVMAVDLRGLFLCCRAVHPWLKKRGKGKIVNVSSGRVLEGTPNRLHYNTAKAGVIGFTRALARELGDDKINVNVVLPGLTLSDTQIASSAPGYLDDAYNQRRALKRAQVPEDLVGTVLYLLSDASDFVTGQSFNVDGGKVMH